MTDLEPDFLTKFETIAEGANRLALVEEACRRLREKGATWVEVAVDERSPGMLAAIVTVRAWRTRPAVIGPRLMPSETEKGDQS